MPENVSFLISAPSEQLDHCQDAGLPAKCLRRLKSKWSMSIEILLQCNLGKFRNVVRIITAVSLAVKTLGFVMGAIIR
jgi:hypothetical protein